METLFDIFGSRDTIKQSTSNVSSQIFTAAKDITTEAVIPGKPVNRSIETNLKGKKVLGDVRNQLLGLNKKSECTSQDTVKKPVLGNICNSKPSPIVNSQAHENPEKTLHKAIKTTQSPMTLEHKLFSKDFNEWPKVETQGSLFWNDDNDGVSSNELTPSFDDLFQSANIWGMGIKPTIRCSPSPLSEELHDDFEFCLNLPSSQSSEAVILKEETVKYPWEM